MITKGEASFGDLVRCPDPDDPTKWAVGRIVGLGGDTVETNGQSLRVNGTGYSAQFSCPGKDETVLDPVTDRELEMSCSIVTMGGHHHKMGVVHDFRRQVVAAKERVDPNEVFLLSDNRLLHDDSRDFGTISAPTCNQRIVFRLVGGAGWMDAEHRLSFVE